MVLGLGRRCCKMKRMKRCFDVNYSSHFAHTHEETTQRNTHDKNSKVVAAYA